MRLENRFWAVACLFFAFTVEVHAMRRVEPHRVRSGADPARAGAQARDGRWGTDRWAVRYRSEGRADEASPVRRIVDEAVARAQGELPFNRLQMRAMSEPLAALSSFYHLALANQAATESFWTSMGWLRGTSQQTLRSRVAFHSAKAVDRYWFSGRRDFEQMLRLDQGFFVLITAAHELGRQFQGRVPEVHIRELAEGIDRLLFQELQIEGWEARDAQRYFENVPHSGRRDGVELYYWAAQTLRRAIESPWDYLRAEQRHYEMQLEAPALHLARHRLSMIRALLELRTLDSLWLSFPIGDVDLLRAMNGSFSH